MVESPTRWSMARIWTRAVLLGVALAVGCAPETPVLTNEPAGAPAADTGAAVSVDGGAAGQAAKAEDAPADTEWERPRFTARQAQRDELVRKRIETWKEMGKEVLAAMRAVPRHLFVPEDQRAQAYGDYPLPIGHGQTISQPSLVAYMTDLLELTPESRVLEIGTGSGYQAAILSELTPHVWTIEIIRELAASAKKRFGELGYKTIQVKQGDGYFGWAEHGPFDAIIVTAAAVHVPPLLVKQLKPGGRMVIPVGGVFDVQQLMLITKDAEGRPSSRSILPVRFVPMTGRMQRRK